MFDLHRLATQFLWISFHSSDVIIIYISQKKFISSECWFLSFNSEHGEQNQLVSAKFLFSVSWILLHFR